MPEPVLCYVDGRFAYFTTKPLDEQWGDDWDDAPYEHNAGTPYGPCWHRYREKCDCELCKRDWNEDGTPKFEITKIAFESDHETPAERADGNSTYSVKDINSGAVAWLSRSRWAANPVVPPIPAGVTVPEFIRLIEASGGTVYLPRKKQAVGTA
jgi:hypothetical protein